MEGVPVRFAFGAAFVSTCLAGFLNLTSAAAVLALRNFEVMGTLGTFFEVDFDTAHAAKVLNEDSALRKTKARAKEDGNDGDRDGDNNVGSRLGVNSRLGASMRRIKNTLIPRSSM